jgi:hypothetical protein
MSSWLPNIGATGAAIAVVLGAGIVLKVRQFIQGYYIDRHCKETRDLTGKVALVTGGVHLSGAPPARSCAPALRGASLPLTHTAGITIGNGGVGFEAAIGLARRGATVVILCRDESRAAAAAGEIARRAGCARDRVQFILADLASLKQVRAAAAEFLRRFSRLDVLMNNAGIGAQAHSLRPLARAAMVDGRDS